jgi:CARDB protein/Ser-Thr-rich glycosyl-phosphatidyl-inositol-anchored membrane family protein
MTSHGLKLSCRLFTGIVLAVFIAISAPYAEGGTLKPIKKAVSPSSMMSVNALPDLVVKPPSWSSPPKAGDPIGTASVLNLTVLNQGSASSGASKLKIACQPLGGTSCPGGLEGTIDIQSLNPGQSMTYAWPPANLSEKWVPGQYRLSFSADDAKQIAESNEPNNASQLIFTVHSKKNFEAAKGMMSISQAPALAVSLAIPVQSPPSGSEHEAGQPLPIRWNKAPASTYPTVNILLVKAQDGQVMETIKSGAANSGAYLTWPASQIYSWPGTSYRIKIITPDNKVHGQSGVFTIVAPKEKKKVPFIRDAQITNGWAYARGGDLGPQDCLSAPQVQSGRQPGSHEVKIGHFVKEASHGDCRYYDEYYFRSRLTFDMDALAGKEIVEATLMVRQGDSIKLYPPNNNSEVSSRCYIYRLNGAWPASPQPLYDFYPGTLLEGFSLYGENETVHIDLLNVVKDWAAGQANHGLMLRGPVNRSQYAPSASVNYYHSVKLLGWYLE